MSDRKRKQTKFGKLTFRQIGWVAERNGRPLMGTASASQRGTKERLNDLIKKKIAKSDGLYFSPIFTMRKT